jgi:hypothetical protein
MDDKITIIEGPSPTFEAVGDGWALGLNESPLLYNIALTRLRTFNGSALIERCHKAWRSQNTMNLVFRDMDGLESNAPIVAARALDTNDGQMLLLWVRLDYDEDEVEVDDDSDFDDPGDELFDDLDSNSDL